MKLRGLGIVSLEHFVSVASAAAPQLNALLGNADYSAMLAYIKRNHPSLSVREPLDNSPYPLGALFEGVAPEHPATSFDVDARNRLYLEAQRLRLLGRASEAIKIENEIERMTLNAARSPPHKE
jgi:hypothetical protein